MPQRFMIYDHTCTLTGTDTKSFVDNVDNTIF